MKVNSLKIFSNTFYLYVIFGLVLLMIAYYKIFYANFISWDDGDVLLNNVDVHHFNLHAFFTKHYVGNYAPITMMFFSIDWFLFHGSSVLQHSINLVFHVVNTLLVFKLCQKIFKDEWKSLFVCLVFCFHPTQIETVAWVAAKNNLIYSLFFILSLIYYAKFLNEQKQKFYIYSFVLFLFSALSKPSAIAMPICLFALDYLLAMPLTRKRIVIKIPYFIVSIIIGLITIYTRTEDKFMTGDHLYSIFERIGFAGYAMILYIYKFLLPINLSVVYPYPQDKMVPIIIGYVFIISLAIYTFYLFKKKNYLVLGAIGFVISNLLLVLQFIPFGEVIIADRYMYLPLIGFSMLILCLFNFSKKVIHYLLLFVAIIYCLLDVSRTSVWKNSITLYSDIVSKYPNSFLALNSLGAEYMLDKNYDLAYRYLNKAIAISPKYYKGYYNRGLLNAQTNNLSAALGDFNKSIDYNMLKNNYKAYVARGNAYYTMKKYDEAINDGNMALVIDSENFKAQFLIANCYDDLNQLDKALIYYNKVISGDSENPLYFMRRAIVFGKMQQYQPCLQDLDKCTSLDGNYAEAYYWKGVVKVNMKQNPCADLKKAVDLGFAVAQQPLATYCK